MKTFRSISRIKIFYSESVVEYIEGVEPQGFLQTTVYLKLGDPSKMTKINLANKRAARSRIHGAATFCIDSRVVLQVRSII